MGAKIVKCYEFVESKGGLQSKMRLAVATSVPSAKANEVVDTPELLAKFRTAVKDITGENAPI